MRHLTATLVSPWGVSRLLIFGRTALRLTAPGGEAHLAGTYVFSDAGKDFSATATPLIGAAAVVPPDTYRTSKGTRGLPAANLDNAGGCFTSLAGVLLGLSAADASGVWTLNIADLQGTDTGSVTAAVLSPRRCPTSSRSVDSRWHPSVPVRDPRSTSPAAAAPATSATVGAIEVRHPPQQQPGDADRGVLRPERRLSDRQITHPFTGSVRVEGKAAALPSTRMWMVDDAYTCARCVASPPSPTMVPRHLSRLIDALPDAVTAAFFASVWIAPRWLGDQAVANGMLMMLVEFVLVHASAMIGATVYQPNLSRRRKALVVLGAGAFYALFVAAFAFSFSAWWPLLAFGWLLLGKLVVVLNRSRPSEATVQHVQRDWAMSAVAYVVGVFITVTLPLPRLGIGSDVVASLGLRGSGLWVEKPHTLIVFGVLYFGFLAWAKWRGLGLVAATKAASAGTAAPPAPATVARPAASTANRQDVSHFSPVVRIRFDNGPDEPAEDHR